jgi:hypothetical protein
MNRTAIAAAVLAWTLAGLNAGAQTKSASEMYWDAVRSSSGPIGLPQAVPDDPRARPPVFRPPIFTGGPYVVPPPEPTYVPVYVPGPTVYVPIVVAPPPEPAHEATPAAPPAPRVPRAPQKFYVLPGCYVGNRPPDPAALPDRCDTANTRVSEW